MVLLTNLRKEAFTFTLYHSVYCANGGECKCQKDSLLRSVEGGYRYTDIINPVGIFLEEGDTKEFHSAVLDIQQVASAVAAGRLKQSSAPVKTEAKVEIKVLDKVETIKKEKVQKA